MMILEFLLILALVCVGALIINGVSDYNNSRCNIPFKESIDLVNVPIVTFVNNGKKLHFLLDTGADYSFIDKGCIADLRIEEAEDITLKVTTSNGAMNMNSKVTLKIEYNGFPFTESFIVGDFKSSFDSAFAGTGIQVHGALGSNFFTKYKYKINYANLAAEVIAP